MRKAAASQTAQILRWIRQTGAQIGTKLLNRTFHSLAIKENHSISILYTEQFHYILHDIVLILQNVKSTLEVAQEDRQKREQKKRRIENEQKSCLRQRILSPKQSAFGSS